LGVARLQSLATEQLEPNGTSEEIIMTIRTIVCLLALGFLVGCGSTIPNRSPLGESFPSVQGKSLDGQETFIPEVFKGKKVILVLAYKQNTQFDVDRWGIGFFTSNLSLPPIYEIPTIPGLIPSLFKGSIDEGMKKGIPKESWKDVITVYGGDGAKLTEWTGTENPNNARVVLLDEQGRVIWFHDSGYGLPPLAELLKTLSDSRQVLKRDP
jgi:hypothetical protein